MIRHYREILYGLMFGLGASAIDIAMHARLENRSAWEELVRPHAPAALYRGMFVLFGLMLGWLLWKKSQREREFRRLSEMFSRFHHKVVAPSVLIHANLQVLLTREDLHLSAETEGLIRSMYETSQHIQSAIKDEPEVR